MATYQYAGTHHARGERFELVQSFTDPAISQCPVCSGPVRKVFSAVGVVFKGSGFYRTDSRAAASSGANGKSESSTSDTPKSDAAKSDSTKSETSAAKTDSSS